MSSIASATTVIVADRDLRVVSVDDNPVSSRASASDHPQLRGPHLLDNVDHIDRAEAEKVCRTILNGACFEGATRTFRRVVCVPEDSVETCVVLLSPHVCVDGSVDGVVYTRFDSRRKALGTDLATDTYYEYLVERANDFVFLADEHGRMVFCNQSIERLTGIPVEESIGRHFSEIIHPDDVENCRNAFDWAHKLGNPLPEFQCRISAVDGSIRHAVVTASLIDAGGICSMLGICRDVTDSVEMREKLLARNTALAAVNDTVLAISSARSLNCGLRSALKKILSALSVEKGSLSLVDDDGQPRIRVFHGFGRHADFRGYVCPLARLCQQEGDILFFSDIAEEPRLEPEVRRQMVNAGIHAAVEVPLGRDGRLKAVLSLVLPRHALLSLEQTEFLNLITGVLGPAIDNAKMQEDLSDRLSLLAMLERLARLINTSRDLDSVIETCLREVAGVVAFEQAILVFSDGDGKADVFSYTINQRETSRKPVKLGCAQMQLLNELSSAQIVRDMDEWIDRYPGIPKCASAIVAPLRRDDVTFGVLKVVHSKSGAFGDRELRLVQAVVEHLAIAALNARLYEIEKIRALELEALAREAHHRIKNNLQMIAGLLSISRDDAGRIGTEAIARCQRQIRAVATVHDLLTPNKKSNQLELRECLGRVAEQALMGMGCGDRIELRVTGEEYWATADAATALGIIVNELVCNAAEHAFGGAARGRVEVSVRCVGSEVSVSVFDNGRGIPEGSFDAMGPDCGLGLVESLANYGLGGRFKIERVSDGTKAVVSFM